MPGQFTRHVDNVDVIDAADINELQIAIENLATPLVPWTTGRYYAPHTMFGGVNTATTALTANRHYAHMIVAPGGTTVDQVTCEVTTAVASSSMRYGLYAAGTNLLPGSRVADFGTVDTSTTGLKPVTVNVTLERGQVYWFVVAADAAITVRTHQQVLSVLGYGPNASNAPTGGGTFWLVPFRNDTSIALPDPFGTPTQNTNTSFLSVRAG
jgi:hypothetical protein